MLNTLKKAVILLSIFILCCSYAFSKGSYSPSFQGYIDGSFTIPTADYLKTSNGRALPPARTSCAIAFDAMPVNFELNNLEFGAGFSLLYNTRSLAAGSDILRRYLGLGFTTGIQYHCNNGFAFGTKLRYLFCSYIPLNSRFDIAELELSPSWDIVRKNSFETTLYMPITASYKSDSVTVRVGIGVDVQYNLVFGAANEKN